MNGGIWFAVGGLSTLICIWGLLEIGKIRMRYKQRVGLKESQRLISVFEEFAKKTSMIKSIGEMYVKIIDEAVIEKKEQPNKLCSICGQKFEKGSHWNVFGRTYDFCFRCGLEGEIEKFIKAEYARAGYGKRKD